MIDKSRSNYAVIGIGQGGHAFASYLKKTGHDVSFYNRPHDYPEEDKVKILNSRDNVIDVTGPQFEGSFKIDTVTSDIGEAIKGRDIIMVSTTADAYRELAEKMGPFMHDDQMIVFHCSGIGGSLEFYETLRRNGYNVDVIPADVDTLIYGCKTNETGKILVKSVKNKMIMGSLHNGGASRISRKISNIYPQFEPTNDVLEPGFGDTPCFHTAGIIFNSERIERGEDFNFYIEGITPDIAKYMEEMDAERVEVADALGIDTWTVMEWLNEAYGTPLGNLHPMLQETEPYQYNAPAPKSLNHRFINEEFPTKLVPQTIIAQILGVKTPKTEEMIEEASKLTGIDYMETGRNLEALGLTERDVELYSEIGLEDYRKRKGLEEK